MEMDAYDHPFQEWTCFMNEIVFLSSLKNSSSSSRQPSSNGLVTKFPCNQNLLILVLGFGLRSNERRGRVAYGPCHMVCLPSCGYRHTYIITSQ